MMISRISHNVQITLIALLFSLFITQSATAGICDIPGGSGIGGTGSPMHGIGGTGAVAHQSGIGGTGQSVKKTGSGIGGTGAPIYNGIGGTGQQAGVVVGTITGFGSICVNGIEIHYTSNTPLRQDGQAVNSDKLALGQVVAVGVSGRGNEVTAKEMHILHAATGPISSIDFVKGQMIVLGQVVQLPMDSHMLNPNKSIQAGDFIAVSGLRDSTGNIIASRIDKVAQRPTVSLRGPISAISNSSFAIQGMKINSPPPANLQVGQNVQISGRFNASSIKPSSITTSVERQLVANVGGLVSIEGYLTNGTSHSATVAGREINVPANLQREVNQLNEHQRVIITGTLSRDNHIELEHVLVDSPQIHDGEISSSHHNEREKVSTRREHTSSSDRTEHNSGDTNKERETIRIDSQDHQNKHEKIDTPEHHKPEKHENERPERHEYEKPEVHEYEKPEVHEYEKPEVHEYEKPEVHEYEKPEVPEYEKPEVHEYEKPEVPEYEKPEVPEYEKPEVPEYEKPEVPELPEHEHDDSHH